MLELLTISVPIFEIFNMLQRGKVKGRYTHVDKVFLGSLIGELLVV